MLIGDVPIFVAHDSADVWAPPRAFLPRRARSAARSWREFLPTISAQTGQLWGNPLYRWEAHAAEDYSWWVCAALRFLLDRVDVVRIDHFRGFEAYWEIPAGSATAATGRWVPGPGTSLLRGHPQAARLAPLDRRRPGA